MYGNRNATALRQVRRPDCPTPTAHPQHVHETCRRQRRPLCRAGAGLLHRLVALSALAARGGFASPGGGLGGVAMPQRLLAPWQGIALSFAHRRLHGRPPCPRRRRPAARTHRRHGQSPHPPRAACPRAYGRRLLPGRDGALGIRRGSAAKLRHRIYEKLRRHFNPEFKNQVKKDRRFKKQ